MTMINIFQLQEDVKNLKDVNHQVLGSLENIMEYVKELEEKVNCLYSYMKCIDEEQDGNK